MIGSRHACDRPAHPARVLGAPPRCTAFPEAWYSDAKEASWKAPSDIKDTYRTASIVGKNRVVFNIKGNSYRLVVAVQYEHGIVFVRSVGAHRDYDHIDVETV